MTSIRRILILVLVTFIFPSFLQAQVAYSTAGHATLQTATLENIMLLQNMRNSQYYCPGVQTWFTGYGAGGYTAGESRWRYPWVEQTNEAKLHQGIGGFLLGGDKFLSEDLRAGLFFSYNNTHLENATPDNSPLLDNNVWETVNTNNYFWGGYWRKNLPLGYFLGSMMGGYSHLNDKMEGTYENIEGKSDAWRALVYGELGTEFQFLHTTLQPFWGLQYYYNAYDAAEVGNEFLRYTFGELETNSLRNIIGLRLSQKFYDIGNGYMTFDMLAFWYHEFLDFNNIGNMDIALTGQTPFLNYTGIDAGRDWAILAPTLEWQIGGLRLWAGYIVLFNLDETIQLGQGGVAYCW